MRWVTAAILILLLALVLRLELLAYAMYVFLAVLLLQPSAVADLGQQPDGRARVQSADGGSRRHGGGGRHTAEHAVASPSPGCWPKICCRVVR